MVNGGITVIAGLPKTGAFASFSPVRRFFVEYTKPYKEIRMTKKLLFVAVALLMALSSFASVLVAPVQAYYRVETADSAPALNAMSGSGTQSNPYIIRNITDLQNINLDLSAYYELGNDIDASATVGWNGGAGFLPIGSVAPYFTGQLDGKGHKVDELFQKSVDPVAPLDRIGTGGVVKNLGLTNVNINDGLDAVGFCLINDGTITNCYSTGAASGSVVDISWACGFCFVNSVTGRITNCYSTVAVSIGGPYPRGANGFCYVNDGTITNCYFAGAISGRDPYAIIDGFCWSNGGTITSCYWDTDVSGVDTSASGTGKTTAQMKHQGTFVGWDFATPIWRITEGVTYPTLLSAPPLTPLILVHGWGSSSAEWNNMVSFLENNGYTWGTNLFAIDFSKSLDGVANGDIGGYANELSNYISWVKGITHVTKVDLVCHSMGGLAARCYIEKAYHNDVRNLVMIGTPNHGTPLAAFSLIPGLGNLIGGTAGIEMIPHSGFLNNLNYGSPWTTSGTDITIATIDYNAIAGTYHRWYVPWAYLVPRPNDEIVSVDSVAMSGVPPQKVPYNHTGEINADDTFQKVLAILLGYSADATIAVQQSSTLEQDEQDNSTGQLAPIISGKIFSGGQQSYGIPISATSDASFVLFWQSGNLSLTLTTPSGTIINSSVAQGNITYYPEYNENNVTAEGYDVTNPESGVWQLHVSALDVPAEGENYSVLTGLETSINLSLNFAKYEYNPGEQISIVAELENGSSPLTGALVTAAIQRPAGLVDILALYDDGLHGDGQATDSIYANAYANTSTSGMYGITVSANGTVNSKGFAIQAVSTVWAEYYPDLTLASSNISFSNNAPLPGKNVTISARISNRGEANAGNASVLFYDGAPADGVLIGENVINVNVGQTANASVSWNATTGGRHEIHVVISPFNGFLEKDYTNNEAYKTIDVACTLIIYSSSAGGNVTTPGEGTFGPYSYGAAVNLVATAYPCYKFVNWTGSGVTAGKVANPNASSTTILMDSDYSVQANFRVLNWSSMTSGITAQLNGIWGSSPSNVFAVGASGNIRY